MLLSPALIDPSFSQTLILKTALQRALAANPRLTAAERDIGIATGQRIQAGVLVNPDLSYERDNSFGSGKYRGTRSAETTLQISQLFELFGKREARIAAGVDVATIQRKAIRLEVLSDTTIAFVTVLGLQRRVQILDEQIAALDRLTPLLQRRVDAGASSPAETGRANVASDLVKADRERVRGLLSSARRDLAVLMGDISPQYVAVSGRLEAIGIPPSFQSVVAAIEANPQLVRWTAVFAQRNAQLLLARLKPYPDVQLSAGWRHFSETGDDAVRLGISVPIPIFDQNQGNILSAQESLAKAGAERAHRRHAGDNQKKIALDTAARAGPTRGFRSFFEFMHLAKCRWSPLDDPNCTDVDDVEPNEQGAFEACHQTVPRDPRCDCTERQTKNRVAHDTCPERQRRDNRPDAKGDETDRDIGTDHVTNGNARRPSK